MRATFTDGRPHDSTCTGCPVCSDEMASLLGMGVAEHSAWLQAQQRRALRHNSTLRQNAEFEGVPPPPSLEQAILEYRRSTPPTLAAELTALEGGPRLAPPARPTGPRPEPQPERVNRDGVPEPPSLVDYIRNQRRTR